MRDLRILFMGTPYFAEGILQKLVENGANVVGVITAADKPVQPSKGFSRSTGFTRGCSMNAVVIILS